MTKAEFLKEWKPKAYFKENERVYDKFESDLDEMLRDKLKNAFYTNPLNYIMEHGKEKAFEKYLETVK